MLEVMHTIVTEMCKVSKETFVKCVNLMKHLASYNACIQYLSILFPGYFICHLLIYCSHLSYIK